jgi:DNA-binding ferritin-like protein
MDQIVMQLVQMEQQMRIYHWQTKSHARHKAFGKIYSNLGDLIDTFAEAWMGRNGRVRVSGPIELQNLGGDVEQIVDGYIETLVGMTDILDPQKDTDLLNIRDEILGEFNKLKYLLTLK